MTKNFLLDDMLISLRYKILYLTNYLMHRSRIVPIILIPFCLILASCKTIAPNKLSASDTAELQFVSIEVRVPNSTIIKWPVAEDEYVHMKGLSVGDSTALKTPEARTYLSEQVIRRLKTVLERVIYARQGGNRPVRLVVAVTSVIVPSVAERVFVGNKPSVGADIDIVDIRTGVVLPRYQDDFSLGFAGQGIGGTLIDTALTEAGVNSDLFDRAAYNYAHSFMNWLGRTQ